MCALPRRTRPGDRLILAYHNVVPAEWSPHGDRSLHLSVDRFEDQLRLIRDEAEIVSLMELLTTDAPRKPRVAITFDDAYASALALGVSACVSAAVPCTVFVAPGILDTVPLWDRAADAGRWSVADRRNFLWNQHGSAETSLPTSRAPMPSGNSQLRIANAGELRAAAMLGGVTLGNHTMSHGNLGAMTAVEISSELSAADVWLRAFAPDKLLPIVAYPFGIAPVDPRAAVPTSCASYGLNVTGGWMRAGQSIFELSLPRWNVPAGISADGFSLRLRGRLSR
jgi:peptidoglycan/xylan/chitin deacetylase (PgdA/CDA1 family)